MPLLTVAMEHTARHSEGVGVMRIREQTLGRGEMRVLRRASLTLRRWGAHPVRMHERAGALAAYASVDTRTFMS